ncbi:class I SAM-dependent methyltransferase [Lederbergia lenta]|uniref:Methyltransferase n=1 Tax=Lederbergia lenta TaxID=1467 RepID=A0A2X4Z6E0_LEDLE|nr:class I SAM-dependent methyltransferase [Lederbergia lenta]MCM3109808.1 class I SAM-dependent methyltransferase [Lederbergia lenta]MEC2324442.1 class I SAM-dependent methyltransferase [Lederbergia lenta]SQI59835.1 methyltransferase [Lederbergia lenta]
MNELDYKSFYEKVGKTNGWDFSKLQVMLEGVLWDFNEEIRKKSKSSDVLLDIGTGGGENLLSIAHSFLFLIGIDLSSAMIEMAQTNLKESNSSNVRFFQMSSDELQFPLELFDVVTCRHAPFSSTEVAKVLKKDGYFFTQQVGEGDKINLKEAFKRGQLNEENGALLSKYVRELKQAGFSEVTTFEYDATDYYQRPEDLIFLLKHTPTIPNFGKETDDIEVLNDFIKNNNTPKGIRTNSKRFLIIARK